MPIYEYMCRECGKVSEVFVRNSEQAARCLDCGSDNLERLISLVYMARTSSQPPDTTCCGRTERCEVPPCSTSKGCQRY